MVVFILGTISFKELKEALILDSIFLIDLRTRSEIASKGKIPKSFSIPIEELFHGALEMTNKNFHNRYGFKKPIKSVELIVFDSRGKYATQAGKYLKSLGYQQVKVYKGGFDDWLVNGGEISHFGKH